jgi:hypothetical protein
MKKLLILLAVLMLSGVSFNTHAGDKEWTVVGKVLLGYEALKIFTGGVRYDRCYGHYHKYGCACNSRRHYRYYSNNRPYPYNSNDHHDHYHRSYSSSHPRNCNCRHHSSTVRQFPSTYSLEREKHHGGHTRYGYVYNKCKKPIVKEGTYIIETQERVISEKKEIINGKEVITKVIEKRTIIKDKQ